MRRSARVDAGGAKEHLSAFSSKAKKAVAKAAGGLEAKTKAKGLLGGNAMGGKFLTARGAKAKAGSSDDAANYTPVDVLPEQKGPQSTAL